MVREVTPSQAQTLLKKGWKAADLHVHTNHSYDVLPDPDLDPETIYQRAKTRGMGWVSFTDHDTMTAYQAIKARPDIITGVEIKIKDPELVGHTLHINVYCLSKQQFLELELIANEDQDLKAFIAYCKKHRLPFLYNHPYWTEPGEYCNHKTIEKVAGWFPLIEINLGRVKLKNDLAIKLAKRHRKGMLANTDTHSGDIGHACTIAPGKTFREWWRNVEKGNYAVVRQDLTLTNIIAEITRRVRSLFSPHLREKQLKRYVFRTGKKPIDVLVRVMLWARRYALGRWILRNFMLALTQSRIPAALYIRTEQQHGQALEKAILNDI